MATRNSLASAIRTSAHSVTGESVKGSGFQQDRNYASSRINPGLGPSVRTANSMNTVTTSPNFYSPFLTPSSFHSIHCHYNVHIL